MGVEKLLYSFSRSVDFFRCKIKHAFLFLVLRSHVVCGKLNSLFKSQTLFGYHDKKNTNERRIRSNYSLSFMHLLISHFLTFTCWGLYNSPGGSRDWQTSSIASSTCLVGGQSSPQCHRWNGPLLKHTEILNITMTWLKKSRVTVLYISLEHKKNNLSVFLSAQFQEKFWYEHYQRRVCVHAPCVYI